MIRHLVFLRYSDETTKSVKERIINDLGALQNEIGGIKAFGHGMNVSPEEAVVRGFKDMFWFDFKDTETRDTYLANETHKGIAARITDATDNGAAGVFVCDVVV